MNNNDGFENDLEIDVQNKINKQRVRKNVNFLLFQERECYEFDDYLIRQCSCKY